MVISQTQPLSRAKSQNNEIDWLYKPTFTETKTIEVIPISSRLSIPGIVPPYTMTTDEYIKYAYNGYRGLR